MGQSAYSIAMQQMGDLINKANLNTEALNVALEPINEQLADIKINVKNFGAKGDGITDDTAAIQAAINYAEANGQREVFIPPGGDYIHTGIVITQPYATLSGGGQKYGHSTLRYIGTGTAITVRGQVNYLSVRRLHVVGTPSVETDYFNTGSVGFDLTDGNVSIDMEDSWVSGFESLVLSNYNSFYNKFVNCRFERALNCLYRFSNNNLLVSGCRFQGFHNAIVHNGGNGPLNILNNAFEVFNGAIAVAIGDEDGLLIFEGNYVEIYDGADLPTNFPNMEASGALPGKFGGNTLFTGPYLNLILRNNELQLGGVFRIATLSKCTYLESVGNNLHLYTGGNNLGTMYGVPSVSRLLINDTLGSTQGVNPGYSRMYNQGTIILRDPKNSYYFFDCIAGKELIPQARVVRLTLLNGWTNGTDSANYGVATALVTRDGLYLTGVVTGTGRTDPVMFVIPEEIRPTEYGTARGYAKGTSYSNYGSGDLASMRYLYNSGGFRLDNSPTNAANIVLDGIFIPFRA